MEDNIPLKNRTAESCSSTIFPKHSPGNSNIPVHLSSLMARETMPLMKEATGSHEQT